MAEQGVSPLVSGIMYLVISIVVVGIILTVAVPFLQELNDVTTINRTQELMARLDEVITTVATEGTGSARTLNVSVRDTTLTVDAGRDLIYLDKKTRANLVASRFRKSVENQFIGNEIKASAYRTRFAGNNAIVLENERWKVTLLELTKSSTTTDQVIQEIEFKPTREKLKANVDFYLDGFQNTLDQNISTELVKEGFLLPRAEAIASVHGPNYDHNARFVLESGADFLRVHATGVDFK